MRPGIYLITLTAPHSGDLVHDREAMGRGWRALSRAATAGDWWGAHAAVYECTPGRAGDGHLHLHVAAISSWIPYDALHRAWRAAMPGAVVLNVQAPRGAGAAGAAANYLGKYVTKGVALSGLSGARAGELLVAFRGRRKVTTSRRFWHDPGHCVTCRRRFYLVAVPIGLDRHAPGAVLRAAAERMRVAGRRSMWLARGDPQMTLRGLPV